LLFFSLFCSPPREGLLNLGRAKKFFEAEECFLCELELWCAEECGEACGFDLV
jgi:hypothetical protein